MGDATGGGVDGKKEKSERRAEVRGESVTREGVVTEKDSRKSGERKERSCRIAKRKETSWR